MRTSAMRVAVTGVLAVVFLIGCETTPTQEGAVVGGALGAGAGAIVGHQSGHQGEGALIGAAAGALTGALVGDQVDERRCRANQPATPGVQRGHYETRIVTTQSGETYEERVWAPDR